MIAMIDYVWFKRLYSLYG